MEESKRGGLETRKLLHTLVTAGQDLARDWVQWAASSACCTCAVHGWCTTLAMPCSCTHNPMWHTH